MSNRYDRVRRVVFRVGGILRLVIDLSEFFIPHERYCPSRSSAIPPWQCRLQFSKFCEKESSKFEFTGYLVQNDTYFCIYSTTSVDQKAQEVFECVKHNATLMSFRKVLVHDSLLILMRFHYYYVFFLVITCGIDFGLTLYSYTSQFRFNFFISKPLYY